MLIVLVNGISVSDSRPTSRRYVSPKSIGRLILLLAALGGTSKDLDLVEVARWSLLRIRQSGQPLPYLLIY